MATAAVPTTARPAARESADHVEQTIRVKKNRWGTIGTYAGVVVIVLWGLAPFYWMVVTSFRDVGFTFDTTPWPTHVTLDNYSTAFSTARGNHFGRALLNSV